mmetsp:Transcript_18019/g.62359  ORF Transcript_18019/g.62359 Transcript_18019/m.62359 type:complete len:367 (+) Transcript_18019:577-1677(+)
MTFSAGTKAGSRSWSSGGRTTILPPDRPLPQPSLASPRTSMVTPGASVKPRLWPLDPLRRIVTAPSGKPDLPQALDTAELSMVPSVRSKFVVSWSTTTGAWSPPAAYASMRLRAAAMSSLSIFASSSWSWVAAWRWPAVGLSSDAGWSRGARSRPAVLSGRPFFRSLMGSTSSTSPAAPMRSSMDVMPNDANVARISSANRKKKLMTCSGWPSNFARSSGSCVAMPTGHVLRWHLRIMMQPRAMSGPVEKAYSSAPSAAATQTSRAVLSWPSVWSRMRSRKSLSTSVCCASAMPSSQGRPAHLMPVQAAAPVPPSPPEMTMWSALALATPAAMTPTPTSDTSFTDTSPSGLAHLRSWMSWARSSME